MSFDRLAPHYRWLEAVLAGGKLQQCRVAWLNEAQHCRRALVVGEGNGRFLAACAKRLPETHFTVVDSSARMLELAQTNWLHAGGTASHAAFVHAVLPGLNLSSGSFDLIVTHCVLDCFQSDQLAQVISELAELATPDATWLITDFAVPERGLARWRAQIILWLAYTFFRLTTDISACSIIAPAPWLESAGFARKRSLQKEWGLLYSELWQRETMRPLTS